MPEATMVPQQLGVQRLDELGWLRGELRYDPCDPYAVTLILAYAQDAVEWVFARDLLIEGLHATVEAPAADPYGVGDVQVWRQWRDGRDLVVVGLSSTDGTCALGLPRCVVSRFLDSSLRRVRRGREGRRIDWDATVERRLAGGAQ